MTDVTNSRTGIGAVIGGVVGAAFGGPMGAGLGLLIGGGVAHASRPKGEMTAKRQVIFARAMESVKDPSDLRKLADAFHGEGLPVEAGMLRKRAALRELPQPKKENRRAAFRKAMTSDDANTIDAVASAFAGEGAVDASKALRDHAAAVRAAHAAGKSAKPLAGGSVQGFADKLAKAILHFGPAAPQAQSAAANLLRAQGREPSPELVSEVLKVAAESLRIEVPAAPAPEKPIEIDMDPARAARAADAAVPPALAGDPPEPTVIGSPAPKTEPEVVADGVAIAGEQGESSGSNAEAVANEEAPSPTEEATAQ